MRTIKENMSLVIAVLFLSAVYISASMIYDTNTQATFMRTQSMSAVAKAMATYQVDEASSSITYLRYKGGSGKVFLKRRQKSGTVTTIMKAKDTWANRATATYTAIND